MKLKGKIRCAVIGGSESGKTFRTIGYSRGMWRYYRMRSIVFDPWPEENDWGPQAWVTSDFERWKRAVTGTKGCVAIWDEATANGGRDRENVPLFSEIRHRHPAIFCIGHAYSSILPLMRINLTDLVMTLADPDDAAEWAKIMKDPAVMQATQLQQYEYMHKRSFQPPRRLHESAAQIMQGIIL
jgi:hypothetical protein